MNTDTPQMQPSTQPNQPVTNQDPQNFQQPTQPSSKIHPAIWFVFGCVLTLFAVGGYWKFVREAQQTVLSENDLSPTQAVVVEENIDNLSPPPTNVQALLKQICTNPNENGNYQFDPMQLPLTLSSSLLEKYAERWCVLSEDNTSYIEMQAEPANTSSSSDKFYIGDDKSVILGMANTPLSLEKVKAAATEPFKELSIAEGVTLFVTARPQGHPCYATDKNVYVDYDAYKKVGNFIILSSNSIHIKDTTPFADLIKKYGTPHEVGPEDTGCEFGQAYDFIEQEKINGFSQEFLDRYFSSYASIPAPYKADAQKYVNDVMGVEVK